MKNFFTKENLKKFFFSFIWLGVLLLVIDFVTKQAVLNHFGVEAFVNDSIRDSNKMITIIPGFLYIAGALNLGAAWSLGYSDKYDGVNPILLVISIVMSAILIVYFVINYKKMKPIFRACLMLMITGAVGNLIDRAFYRESITGFKGVVDWIQVYLGSYSYPTFNIADSCLVVGVAILIVYFVIEEIKEAIKKGKNGEYKYSPKELEEKNKNEGNKNN